MYYGTSMSFEYLSVGVCTQDLSLRKKFTGTPEKVVNLFNFIAQEVREILSDLGFKNLNEIIGRTDHLRQVSIGTSNLDDLDLNPLLVQADPDKLISTILSSIPLFPNFLKIKCDKRVPTAL